MDTPICDFVRHYAGENAIRLHMPGHKGKAFLGMEQLDITEIDGADSLYEAEGIICKSEENAGSLFGCKTLYSTEGSSQSIRAMLYLALLDAKERGKEPLISAARNVHKTFLSAVALLDLQVQWLYPEKTESYLSCNLSPEALEAALLGADVMPTAVYVTSPDYLGNLADIEGLARVCRRYDIRLLVDNAHGAYLRFLQPSRHPMDLGADLCCDSAHKTLPVLTGGAYLHLSSALKPGVIEQAKRAMALFGSTSPSYLILQSLDAANDYLESYGHRLADYLPQVESLKADLKSAGFSLAGQEPLKITILTKPYGYAGTALAGILQEQGLVCEFSDPDHLVLMLTPEIGEKQLEKLRSALMQVEKRDPIPEMPPEFRRGQRVCSIRDAMLSPCVRVPAEQSEGAVLAAPSVGCPPAVPILICGERIDRHAIRSFQYYGIHEISVMKQEADDE